MAALLFLSPLSRYVLSRPICRQSPPKRGVKAMIKRWMFLLALVVGNLVDRECW